MSGLLGTFLFLIFGGVFFLEFIEGLFGTPFSFFMIIYGIFLIIRSIKKKADKEKVKQQQTKTTANDAKILNSLRSYFQNDARLYFDDETYITPSNGNTITFDNLNIYMRDEFVGTLADYKLAFPNAYNTFMDMINSYLKRKKFTKSTTTATNPVNPEPTNKTANNDRPAARNLKDAQFYIDKLNEMNKEIEEEHITNDLYETVLYLSQIKKIEDTFPKCKEKTTKLYQYYLPMLIDILENYKRLSINANLHKEFQENEDRLMKTIVLINGALKALTENLCDEYYLEMATDMKTLEALLKKDGLASDELTFEKMKKEKEVTSNG